MGEEASQANASTVFENMCFFQEPSKKIKTKEFLKSSADAASLIDKFGKVFSPVTKDMRGNIQKLTKKYEEDIQSNAFLEDMILKEQSTGEEVATDALLWLKRGLNFLSNLFQLIVEDSQNEQPSNDLAPILKKSYSTTLEPHHGWLGVQLFNVLSRFMPNRKQLMYTLALDTHHCDEIVIKDIQTYNEYLSAVVKSITEFYNNCGLESPTTV